LVVKAATPAAVAGRPALWSSGQQIVDRDPCIGASERRDALARCISGDAAVAVFIWIAVDLETADVGCACR